MQQTQIRSSPLPGRNTVVIGVSMTPDLADRVKALAAASERSLSSEIRVALRRHLETHETPVATGVSSQTTGPSARHDQEA